jgi:hypothetical protein
MLIESIVVGVAAVLICASAVMISLRPPQCPTCLVPLQAVEETVRDLGPYGVETATHYECSDCYRALRRVFILTHIG